MDARKREIRTVDCQLAIREAEEGQESQSRTIVTGTAIVFDAESEVLDDWGEKFREVIKPEACTMEFLNTQDIKMNLLHERELTIARCNKGKGSMRLWVDEKGVNFEFEAPKCDIGERCLEMVRRGDYSGCSFEFYPKDYDVDRNGDEVKITHRSFEFISALTIGLDPAYRQTSVNVRELAKPVEAEEDKVAREAAAAAEEAKREQEAKEREEQARLSAIKKRHNIRKKLNKLI